MIYFIASGSVIKLGSHKASVMITWHHIVMIWYIIDDIVSVSIITTDIFYKRKIYCSPQILKNTLRKTQRDIMSLHQQAMVSMI